MCCFFFVQICSNSGTTKTFHELRELTMNVAKNFRYFGCESGHVIFFMTKNTADIAPLLFAALYLGAQVTAVPIFSSRTEYEEFLNLTKPKFLICDLNVCKMSKQCLVKLKIDATLFSFDGQSDDSIAVNILFEKRDADTNIE